MKKLFILLATCCILASCKTVVIPQPRQVWKYKLLNNSTLRVHIISNKCNLVTYRVVNTKSVQQLPEDQFTYEFVKVSNGSRAPIIGTKDWLVRHDH